MDTPTEQLRAITLPADPTPIFYPSVENFAEDETDFRTVSAPTVLDPITGIPIPSTTLRTTENCENRTTQPYGDPVGLDQNAVMPYNGGTQQHFGIPLPILSITANGTDIVTVTCSAVHNLQPNDQISVEGLLSTKANGFFSVVVPTATMFTYQTYGPILAGSLLTPMARIVTALIGLPYGYKTIPQVGP